jgi:hypothetical protein
MEDFKNLQVWRSAHELTLAVSKSCSHGYFRFSAC